MIHNIQKQFRNVIRDIQKQFGNIQIIEHRVQTELTANADLVRFG